MIMKQNTMMIAVPWKSRATKTDTESERRGFMKDVFRREMQPVGYLMV